MYCIDRESEEYESPAEETSDSTDSDNFEKYESLLYGFIYHREFKDNLNVREVSLGHTNGEKKIHAITSNFSKAKDIGYNAIPIEKDAFTIGMQMGNQSHDVHFSSSKDNSHTDISEVTGQRVKLGSLEKSLMTAVEERKVNGTVKFEPKVKRNRRRKRRKKINSCQNANDAVVNLPSVLPSNSTLCRKDCISESIFTSKIDNVNLGGKRKKVMRSSGHNCKKRKEIPSDVKSLNSRYENQHTMPQPDYIALSSESEGDVCVLEVINQVKCNETIEICSTDSEGHNFSEMCAPPEQDIHEGDKDVKIPPTALSSNKWNTLFNVNNLLCKKKDTKDIYSPDNTDLFANGIRISSPPQSCNNIVDQEVVSPRISRKRNEKCRTKHCHTSKPYWEKSMEEFYDMPWVEDDLKLQHDASDPKLWEIIASDRYPSWNNSHKFCYKCKEMGHKEKDCKRTPKPDICFMCGLRGHLQFNCPSNICLRCGEEVSGQVFPMSCVSCLGVRVPLRCMFCGKQDHFHDQCLSTRVRDNEEINQLTDFKAVLKPLSEIHCPNCLQTGHLFHNCPRESSGSHIMKNNRKCRRRRKRRTGGFDGNKRRYGIKGVFYKKKDKIKCDV